MNTERDKKLVDSFVKSMEESIRYYANGEISEDAIRYLAEYVVKIAISNDIPGLVLESGSYDALIERLIIAVPEILEANHLPKISLVNYISERHQVYANG